MRKLKIDPVNYILAFLQAIFLTISVSVFLVYFGFLSQNAIQRSLMQSDYYNYLKIDIITRIEDLLIPTGISSTILEGIFEVAVVEEHTNLHIQNAFSQQSNALDTLELEAMLTDNIEVFLENEGVILPEEEVNDLVHLLMQQYESETRFPFISQLARIGNLYRMLMVILIIGSAICFIVADLVLHLRTDQKYQRLRLQSYALGGSGLMLLIFPIVVYLSQFYVRLQIAPLRMHQFFVVHIEQILQLFIISGVLVLLLAIVFALPSERQQAKLLLEVGED